jgi:hypothetical protein
MIDHPTAMGTRLRSFLNPASVTLLLLVSLVIIVIANAGGDPLALARLGTRFENGDPNGTEGYDGQFVYYIARDPSPQTVAPLLDVPAYRYQRILLPLLARIISLGNPLVLPWVLALLGILAQAIGTWVVAERLSGWGASRWYALVYGLWAGFVLSIRLDLPEPLAYGLIAGALLLVGRERHGLSWLLYALALFAKEVTIFFIAAQLFAYVLQRRWRYALALGVVALLPYVLFQGWLWSVFGQPGIGSGGEMATAFEWIPFLGILRIGAYSGIYLLAMLLVFGPAIILPSVWGIWNAVRKWIAGEENVIVFGLFFNALIIPFLPFSTFRETGGLLRFACGLILALLLFAGRYRIKRVLNYSWFWMVLNVFLLK